MNRTALLFITALLVCGLWPMVFVAFAQDLATAGAIAEAVDWPARIEAGLLTWLPRLMALASILAAVFPSVGKVMKIIDVLAVNYGKARNDPKIQKWGG